MGAGYHGGFGNTNGEKAHQNNTSTSNNKSTHSFIRFYTIQDNAIAMSHTYPMTNGFFGVKGKNHRVIFSEDQYKTAADFYSRITRGGVEKALPNNKGKITYLKDGTKIVYRQKTSTPDSPAIEITVSAPNIVKGQKIHFLKEKTKK